MSLLIAQGLDPFRIGKPYCVKAELQPWTIEKRSERHPLWKATENAKKDAMQAKAEMQEMKNSHIWSQGSPKVKKAMTSLSSP